MKLAATKEKNGIFKDPLGPKTYSLKSEKPMFPMFYLYHCYSDPQHNSDMRSVQDMQCAGSHGYICWELANNASEGAKLLSGGRTSAPWVALVEPRLEKRLKCSLCIN